MRYSSDLLAICDTPILALLLTIDLRLTLSDRACKYLLCNSIFLSSSPMTYKC